MLTSVWHYKSCNLCLFIFTFCFVIVIYILYFVICLQHCTVIEPFL